MDSINAYGGMGMAAAAMEAQRLMQDTSQHTVRPDAGETVGVTNATDKTRPAPLATGRAVTGLGGKLDVTV